MLLSSYNSSNNSGLNSTQSTPGKPYMNMNTSTSRAEDTQNPRIAPDLEGAIDAARRGDVQFLQGWVARGGDFQAKLDNSYVSLTLLQLAACEGDEVAAHTLLRAGAVVDFVEPHEGYSALMIAARYGHVGVMRLLQGRVVRSIVWTVWDTHHCIMLRRQDSWGRRNFCSQKVLIQTL